jgi:cell pole-organizing protein PopZ
MGDISAEPSMEEILSSIKRIIAEEGDAATASRTRRPRAAPKPAPAPFDLDEHDEVLELSQPVEERIEQPGAEEKPMPMGSPTPPEPAALAEPILSPRAAEATRGPLEALSRMVVKPEVQGSDTLEGLVRELLKPMLRDWLDANLPQIVETMVAREISRITGRNG